MTAIHPASGWARCACLFLALGLLPVPAAGTTATEKEQVVNNDQEIKKDLLSWMNNPFVYQREGRPDPFEPFLPEKLTHIDVPAEELTGMRLYEPGQLTLVSIVMTEREPLAMVQDSAGKGYIIKRGSRIGRSGVVSTIAPNEVKIEQQMLTATGEKRTQAVEMVLRKEGEN